MFTSLGREHSEQQNLMYVRASQDCRLHEMQLLPVLRSERTREYSVGPVWGLAYSVLHERIYAQVQTPARHTYL